MIAVPVIFFYGSCMLGGATTKPGDWTNGRKALKDQIYSKRKKMGALPLGTQMWQGTIQTCTCVYNCVYIYMGITCFIAPTQSFQVLYIYICARFRDVVLCMFHSSCARFTEVVHVSQKLYTFHKPPNNVRVQLYTHWAHSNQQKHWGDQTRSPDIIYIYTYNIYIYIYYIYTYTIYTVWICICIYIYANICIYDIYIYIYIHTWCVDIYGVNHLRLREKSLLVQAPTRYPNHTWKIQFFLRTSTDIHRQIGFLWFSSGFFHDFPLKPPSDVFETPMPYTQKLSRSGEAGKTTTTKGPKRARSPSLWKNSGENTGSW